MKKLVIQIVLLFLLVNLAFSQSNASSSKSNSDQGSYASEDYLQLTLNSGFINPISPSFLNYYYTSLNLGFDLSYRLNSEVAFYGEVRNNFLASKDSTSPATGYFETTFGARYYVGLGSVRSSLFFESAFGPYIFFGGTSKNPDPHYNTQTKIRLGGNVGLGAELFITNSIFLTLKSKINSVYDSNGSTTYVTGSGGISFRL
jgi:hypothetical protein